MLEPGARLEGYISKEAGGEPATKYLAMSDNNVLLYPPPSKYTTKVAFWQIFLSYEGRNVKNCGFHMEADKSIDIII